MHKLYLRLDSNAALAALTRTLGEVLVEICYESCREGMRVDCGAYCPAQPSGRILALQGAMRDAGAVVTMTLLWRCSQYHVGRKASRLLNWLLCFRMLAAMFALVDSPALVSLELSQPTEGAVGRNFRAPRVLHHIFPIVLRLPLAVLE